MSWVFVTEWAACLARRIETFSALSSYMIVGDQCLKGEWQGDYGIDVTVCAPWTARSLANTPAALSLIETLLLAAEFTGDARFAHDAEGRPFFGRTSHFISYCWAAPLSRLLASLEAKGAASEGGFFWIDIFSVAQCKHSDAAVANNVSDVSAFETVVTAARATWLWCEPWYQPATFNRVWCLFEALKTLDQGKSLELVFAPSEAADLRRTLAERFDDVLTAISSIDVAAADATVAADKASIMNLIGVRRGGVDQFNADLATEVRRCVFIYRYILNEFCSRF